MSIKTSDNNVFLLWKDVYKDKRQAMFFFIGRMSKKTTDNHVLLFGRMSIKTTDNQVFFFGRMSIKTSDNHVLFFERMSIKTSDNQCFSSLEGCL